MKNEITRYDLIREAIESMDTSSIVCIHNGYCEEANYADDYVYSMNDFDELMDGNTPWEACRAAFFGNFNPTHDYFRFNAYANLESFDYWESENSGISTDEIARWIDENENDLGNPDLESILETYDQDGNRINGEDEEDDEDDGE